MIIETKRLYLRKLKEEDFDELCKILCDPEVMYAYEHAFSHEEVRTWLLQQQLRYESDGVGLWAVIRKRDDVFIGQCGITRQQIMEDEVWEIGYLMNKQYWHQGYASEAARACKQYAFEVMKLKRVYSIIRDTNIASQYVAKANGMKKTMQFMKHYDHIDMLHDVYMVECDAKEIEYKYHIYMDAEFDAIKIQQKFHQMVISIGAIIVDQDGKELSTFYETVHPKAFRHMTHIVHRMTKLNDDIIRSSRTLKEVMQTLCDWVAQYDPDFTNTIFYSFGPDDKRTILQHCRTEQVELHGLLLHVMDLQKVLSAKVMYQGRIVSPTLSLDDMKLVYDMQGEVEHNALNDARDLMMIHQASMQNKTMNEDNITAIVNRKVAKQMEARRKQQKHLRNVMQKRFTNLPKKTKVLFCQDVLDQFHTWESRDEHFKMHFKKHALIFEGITYSYENLQMFMIVDTQQEIPSVLLKMVYEGVESEYKYVLDYRNATPIENIAKRCREAHKS